MHVLMGLPKGDKAARSLAAFSAIMGTPEGKRVMGALSANGGALLSSVTDAIKKGDRERASMLISGIMSTPEGRAVSKKIIEALGD